MVNKIKIKKSKSKINKKSLSPLISVILLIVISVILVSVVLGFGQGFTNQGLSDSDKVIKECNQITMFSGSKVDPKGNISFKNISPGNETHTIVGYKILSTSEDSNFNNFIYFEDENKTVTPGSTTIFQIPKFPPEEKFTIQLLTDKGEYISLDGIKNVPEELQDIPGPEPCSLTPTNGEIYYLEHLDYIDTNTTTLAASYTLQRDLNFLDDDSYCEPETYKTSWTTGTGFTPIGTYDAQFTGSLDGSNYTISNLYINRPTTDNVGFFGYVAGDINRIGVIDINIIGKYNVGGLVGSFSGYSAEISNSYTTGTIIGTESYIGGLVGYAQSLSNISKSYSATSLSGDYYVGGLIGYIVHMGVYNSYAIGNVSGTSFISGLVGSSYEADITNCYSTGVVQGLSITSGLATDTDHSIVLSSYWDMNTSGKTTSALGTGKTTTQMKQEATFTDWNFSTIWAIDEGTSYPYLQWQD